MTLFSFLVLLIVFCVVYFVIRFFIGLSPFNEAYIFYLRQDTAGWSYLMIFLNDWCSGVIRPIEKYVNIPVIQNKKCREHKGYLINKNKNVDIKFSAHDALLEQPSSGTLKAKILESQIIFKSLGARKPKGLNRIA